LSNLQDDLLPWIRPPSITLFLAREGKAVFDGCHDAQVTFSSESV
jgi:hypothetical protein